MRSVFQTITPCGEVRLRYIRIKTPIDCKKSKLFCSTSCDFTATFTFDSFDLSGRSEAKLDLDYSILVKSDSTQPQSELG